MELHVGLDVSLETTALCIVDDKGGKMLEGAVITDPEAVCRALRPHISDVVRIGIEACSMGIWLARELRNEGLPVTVVKARHMRSAMSAMRNKTDRNDAWHRPDDAYGLVSRCM